MLKGIHPLPTPALLQVLAAMGHGDEIVIADANFTATSLAGGKPVVSLAGVGVQRTCEAVRSLLSLDTMVDQPEANMQVGGTPDGDQSAQQRTLVAALTAAGHTTSATMPTDGTFCLLRPCAVGVCHRAHRRVATLVQRHPEEGRAG